MMNEAREELRNMRQMEHKSVSVYMYRWGRALYRSSGIRPSKERHPHVIKDFVSSLKKNIRNKIANRWAEMQHPPSTVERAFKLASDMEKQLQVADSFKLEFPNYPPSELNEMSAEETSGDEQEINEMSKVRNGEIMEIITTTNALVTVAIMVTATNNNNTVPKKTDKSNSGHKS